MKDCTLAQSQTFSDTFKRFANSIGSMSTKAPRPAYLNTIRACDAALSELRGSGKTQDELCLILGLLIRTTIGRIDVFLKNKDKKDADLRIQVLEGLRDLRIEAEKMVRPPKPPVRATSMRILRYDDQRQPLAAD